MLLTHNYTCDSQTINLVCSKIMYDFSVIPYTVQ